jgi:hypothetical protein
MHLAGLFVPGCVGELLMHFGAFEIIRCVIRAEHEGNSCQSAHRPAGQSGTMNRAGETKAFHTR